MRNLKRVLSLALASAMLLGMMVMGAGAADTKKKASDLTDIDKVTNQEAVALLVDIGAIEGKSDGSFGPTEIVNRATMAKLITMLMMGNVDQDAFKGTATDLKDINGHWAEGYIKFCYSNKIITGDGAGHFFPDEPVTAVQAAKMLLVAIGYDAKDRGYENDSNWSVNIMKDAQTTSVSATQLRSLTKGLSIKSTDPLSRDNAAQMIFNTLFVRTVEPEYQYDMGTKYISKYNFNTSMAGTTYNGLTRVVGVLTGINTDSYAQVAGGAPVVAYSNKITGEVINMGKAVAYYKDTNGLVSTSVVADKDNAAVTVPGDLQTSDSTKSTYVAKWLTANGLALSGATTDYIVTNYTAATGTAIVNSDLAGIGNYAVAYVIDKNGDGVIDAFVKTTKTVSEVTGAFKTKVVDGKTTVSVPGVTAGYVNAMGYEDLAKGDLVMHITYAGTTYITKCETVTGKLTGFKGTTAIYLDGTSYTLSSGSFGGQTVAQMSALDSTAKKDVTLYLDENGNALFAKLVDSTSTYNVAVVLGYTTSGSSVEDESIATARLLMADGTVTVVNVSGGNGTDIAAANTLTSANNTVGTHYYPVAYSIDSDGKYTLTKLTTSNASFGSSNIKYTALSNATITPGKAAYASGFVGNSSTVFTSANYSTTAPYKLTTVTANTGIAAAPKFTADSTSSGVGGANGIVIDVNGVSAMVFLTGGAQQDNAATSNYIYIPSTVAPSYSTADKTYTYAGGYMNGEKQDIVSKVVLNPGNVEKVGLNDDGVVVSTAAHGGQAYKGISYAGGVITVDTATVPLQAKAYYTLADDAKVFEVASDGTVTEVAPSGITADKTDGVIVLGASDMASTLKAQYVYIIKTEASAVTLTVKAEAGTGNGTNTPWGSESGVDEANAKTATISVTSGSAAAHAITYTLTGADGALVSVIGTVPGTTAANGTLAATTLLYKVTSEDGSAFCFYKVTLTITA